MKCIMLLIVFFGAVYGLPDSHCHGLSIGGIEKICFKTSPRECCALVDFSKEASWKPFDAFLLAHPDHYWALLLNGVSSQDIGTLSRATIAGVFAELNFYILNRQTNSAYYEGQRSILLSKVPNPEHYDLFIQQTSEQQEE